MRREWVESCGVAGRLVCLITLSPFLQIRPVSLRFVCFEIICVWIRQVHIWINIFTTALVPSGSGVWIWFQSDSELIGGVVNSRALWRWETAISFEWEQTVFQRSPSIYTNKVRGLTLWGFRLEGRVHRLHLWERICCADSLHQLTWWQIPWGSVHRFFFVVLAWIQLHSDDSELTTHNKEARNREEQLNSNVVAFLNLIKGKLCNNLQQFPCMSHFYMDHMWEDCNTMWKMRPYPSLSVDTSLRMIYWSCLMPQQ